MDNAIICDIPKQTGLNVMLWEYVAGDKSLINQPRFECETGFVLADEKPYPSLVINPQRERRQTSLVVSSGKQGSLHTANKNPMTMTFYELYGMHRTLWSSF